MFSAGITREQRCTLEKCNAYCAKKVFMILGNKKKSPCVCVCFLFGCLVPKKNISASFFHFLPFNFLHNSEKHDVLTISKVRWFSFIWATRVCRCSFLRSHWQGCFANHSFWQCFSPLTSATFFEGGFLIIEGCRKNDVFVPAKFGFLSDAGRS